MATIKIWINSLQFQIYGQTVSQNNAMFDEADCWEFAIYSPFVCSYGRQLISRDYVAERNCSILKTDGFWLAKTNKISKFL